MVGVYKRGRIWWGRAQKAGIEHRRSLETTDRGVAEKRLRAWLAELDRSAWKEKAPRTFDEAAARFITDHLPGLKPASRVRYGVSLKQLAGTFEGVAIENIGKALLSEFETRRRSEGVRPPTIRRDLACLSSILTCCEDWEWLDDGRNPVPAYMRRKAKRGLKEAPSRSRYLSEAEEAALVAECKTPWLRAAVILSIETGLRKEELLSLTWPQVDVPRGVIRTTRATKNGKPRVVPLTRRAAQILAQCGRHRENLFVLHRTSGERYQRLNDGLAAACERAGINDLIWHDLRRTAGCRWLQRDRRSMEEVSTMLGHSSVVLTERTYAFLDDEKVAASIGAAQSTGTDALD